MLYVIRVVGHNRCPIFGGIGIYECIINSIVDAVVSSSAGHTGGGSELAVEDTVVDSVVMLQASALCLLHRPLEVRIVKDWKLRTADLDPTLDGALFPLHLQPRVRVQIAQGWWTGKARGWWTFKARGFDRYWPWSRNLVERSRSTRSKDS